MFFFLTADKKPHLLGASKCTYGPSYWCSHVDNAKDCDVSEIHEFCFAASNLSVIVSRLTNFGNSFL